MARVAGAAVRLKYNIVLILLPYPAIKCHDTFHLVAGPTAFNLTSSAGMSEHIQTRMLIPQLPPNTVFRTDHELRQQL